MKHPVPAQGEREVSYHPDDLARNPKLTISLLSLSLRQALIPHQRRLLISHQPGNRDTLQNMTLIELSIGLRVADNLGKDLLGAFKEVEQLLAPFLGVQVEEEGTRGVSIVGDVDTAVLGSSGVVLVGDERVSSSGRDSAER